MREMTDTARPPQDEEAERRAEWRTRFIGFLLPRLRGGEAEMEQGAEMILSALEAAYCEGIRDAADTARQIGQRSERARTVAETIAKALYALEQSNRSQNDGQRLA
jgi:hypothetical protein